MRMRVFSAALFLCAAALFAEQGIFEKTISFPPEGQVKLDWSYEKCTVQTVTLEGYPNREEIDKARHGDPNDHSRLVWEFRVDNRSPSKYAVKVVVEIFDKSGQVIRVGDHTTNVGCHSAEDIKVTTRMRTAEAADAPKAHLRAEIVPK